MHNPLRLPRETTSQRPKVARTCGVLYILTSKCASRHNGVHFFDISSKTVPRIVFLVHFDFEMCFAPQRRTLFRHLNFQKCSEREVFFSFFICKRASHHNGVHFFDISTPKSAPNVRCFLAFSLANVLLATTACTFSTSQLPKVVRSWCALYILTSKCASRYSSLLSDSSHLCFSPVHIVGNLTLNFLRLFFYQH